MAIKILLVVVLTAFYLQSANAQNYTDEDDEFLLKIKKMNSKVHALLAEDKKTEAFAYMDSIRILSNEGNKRSSALYRIEKIQPKTDKAAEISGIVKRMISMIRIESGKECETGKIYLRNLKKSN